MIRYEIVVTTRCHNNLNKYTSEYIMNSRSVSLSALPRQVKPKVEVKTDLVTPSGSSRVTKEYTNEEIDKLISDGYIVVHQELWDYIPPGSHIRYMKCDDGAPKGQRFKPGAFVHSHVITNDGRKMFVLETIKGFNGDGHGQKTAGYARFHVAYNDIEKIWKKYPSDSFIEVHLIHNSLAQKSAQINELTKRILELEKRIHKLSKK